MPDKDVSFRLINPYYAINGDPTLARTHTPGIDVDQWVQANLILMEELGSEERLRQLLVVLQGDYPDQEQRAGR